MAGQGGEAVLLAPREVPLGGTRAMTVRRTLPHRDVRTIGAWCFVDQYGPQVVGADGSGGMDVPPHPHTGLQTVTWLLDGEVQHDDSLGHDQAIRPGELNLMTAGHGIAHSERSKAGWAGALHGVQLWVALPEATRDQAPRFEHHDALPVLAGTGVSTTVVVGALDGVGAPARTDTPLLAAVVDMAVDRDVLLPLDPTFEHGVLPLDGSASVDGFAVGHGALLGLPRGRLDVRIATTSPGRVLVLGGTPFEDDLVMWWNFVGGSHDEVVEARRAWEAEDRFGPVDGYPGLRLAAPALPTTRLKARPSGGLLLR